MNIMPRKKLIRRLSTTRRRSRLIIVMISVLLVILLFYGLPNVFTSDLKLKLSPYPDGKNFAFSITDDPDHHTVEKIEPIYDLLTRLGFRTTMLVWVKEATHSNGIPEEDGQFYFGDTCERELYLRYVKELQDKGFEIGMHTASSGNDFRNETMWGYERFRELFGAYPKMNIMHYHNLENIYWGKNVFRSRLGHGFVGLFSKIPYSGERERTVHISGETSLKKKPNMFACGGRPVSTHWPSIPVCRIRYPINLL